MSPIPGTVRTVESASQEMVPEGSGSRHCARTAEVSGSPGTGGRSWSRWRARGRMMAVRAEVVDEVGI